MSYDETDIDALREALIGRSVVRVNLHSDRPLPDGAYTGPVGEVELDDGSVLVLAGNGPHCACSAGDYDLTRLNDQPINGITNVTVTVDGEPDEYGEGMQRYGIFVLAFGGDFQLAEFEGDDGNGYYGTGFVFDVLKP
jgi:hypothetical protein